MPGRNSQLNEDAIRERAYLLWEADGGPHGKPDEYWYRAAAETAITEPTPRTAKPAAPKATKTARLELKAPKRKDKPAKAKPAAKPRAAVPKAAK